MVGSVCAHVSDLSVPDVPSKRERGVEEMFLSEELFSVKLQVFILSDYLKAEI